MTPLILLLAAAQAGLLLWAAVHLSNVAMRPRKISPFLWSLALLALPLWIANDSAQHDRHRALCSVGDCVIIALSVAGVRILAVNKEEARIAVDHAEAVSRAAEAVEAARRARKAEQLRAAAAALEARAGVAQQAAVDPNAPPRHLTPSILRGGAPSPRLPASPRK